VTLDEWRTFIFATVDEKEFKKAGKGEDWLKRLLHTLASNVGEVFAEERRRRMPIDLDLQTAITLC